MKKLILLLALVSGAAPAFGETAEAPTIEPYADVRYRLEIVDQATIARDAAASTLRVRAGVKASVAHGLSATIEGEAIVAIGASNYNDTVNGKTIFPIVADPQDILLNQAFVAWKPDAAVEFTAGRQAINLDNQRWIGSVGWRQNDQTFDAVRVHAQPAKGLTGDYLYAWRVNRVFGPDSPAGIWRENNIHGARIAYAADGWGTVSAYGYWLDIPAAAASSSRTVGVRLAGEHPVGGRAKLVYAAEYARQTGYAANPRRSGHDYLLIQPGVAVGAANFQFGYERLAGDGTSALQTPLATLHAFNGWADIFLTTPPAGLRDIYVDAGYRLTRDGPLKGLALRGVFHDYRSTAGDIAYGREWDAAISYPVRPNITVSGKAAHYDARGFASDTSKFWLSVEAKF